jgi:hypothetical protein
MRSLHADGARTNNNNNNIYSTMKITNARNNNIPTQCVSMQMYVNVCMNVNFEDKTIKYRIRKGNERYENCPHRLNNYIKKTRPNSSQRTAASRKILINFVLHSWRSFCSRRHFVGIPFPSNYFSSRLTIPKSVHSGSVGRQAGTTQSTDCSDYLIFSYVLVHNS